VGFSCGIYDIRLKGGDAELYSALEAKTAGAIRGNISNAANISQSLMYAAYNSAEYGLQKRAKHRIMQQRYEAVKGGVKRWKIREIL
jgi:hypothetical protein